MMLEDITPADPTRISPGKSLESQNPLSKPPANFESYMQGEAKGAPGVPTQATSSSTAIQPGQISQLQASAPTIESVLAQSKNAQDGLGSIAQQLNTPNLKLKRSQAHILKGKLQEANERIRASSKELGLHNPEMKFPSNAGPLSRFLAYVGDGQDRLASVQNELKNLSSTKGGISPAKLLLIQTKINQAQQEIDYAVTLLSKVIDSLKTILNTQL